MGNFIDLSGRKFRRLTVLYRVENKGKTVRYMCRCDCGTEKILPTTSLLGKVVSCGCRQKEARYEKLEDLSGKRFGKLTVLSRTENKGTKTIWNCVCDCGNETKVSASNLKRGTTKSCGCYQKERTSESNYKHGGHNNRVYRIWQRMKSRCYYDKYEHFDRYGGRGITVCEEWRNDFKAFYDWAMANGYSDDLTIDRIDVNGNYEPSNCRWATKHEQALNQERNKVYYVFGEKIRLCQISEKYKISKSTLYKKLKKGLTIEQIIKEKENIYDSI